LNHLVAIVGPTGVGKSQLALRLAQTFGGEVVSADSRQVYCHMDIGTAKPSREELSLVPHHLINIVSPGEDFSLAQYQALAGEAITGIHQRHRLPILAGGSGLYVWAVLEGWGIPPVPPDPEFRQSLEAKATQSGRDGLYRELVAVDPVAGQRIDRRNVRRVVRALEVQRSTRTPFSQLQQKQAPPLRTLIIGLTADRAELYRRIDSRVDRMIEQGLVAEVEKLMNMGYDFSMPSMSGIGYRQIGLFLKGEITLATAVAQTKFETHRFVRHQYNWFRLDDSRIKWFDTENRPDTEITRMVAGFIKEA